jgi:hypothetical protein
MEEMISSGNKKSWEELIAFFPMIRCRPYKKRRVQQFFYRPLYIPFAGTCLPSRCLETMRGGVHRHTDSKVILQFHFY